MGALNRACIEHKGRAKGVIHRKWIGEATQQGLDEIVVAGGESLAERKALLMEGANCFIALPGGVGTLDELFEVVALCNSGFGYFPVCVLNVDGYYDGLRAQLDRAAQDGLSPPHSALLYFADSASDAVDWTSKQVQQPSKVIGIKKTKQVWNNTPKTYDVGFMHGAAMAIVAVAVGAGLMFMSKHRAQ